MRGSVPAIHARIQHHTHLSMLIHTPTNTHKRTQRHTNAPHKGTVWSHYNWPRDQSVPSLVSVSKTIQ